MFWPSEREMTNQCLLQLSGLSAGGWAAMTVAAHLQHTATPAKAVLCIYGMTGIDTLRKRSNEGAAFTNHITDYNTYRPKEPIFGIVTPSCEVMERKLSFFRLISLDQRSRPYATSAYNGSRFDRLCKD